jgi:acyl-CoA thioesterase FadM
MTDSVTRSEIRESRVYLQRIDVPFDDIDAGGVLYHAHYLNYCDRARNAVFGAAGWGWDRMVAQRSVLAVVRVEAEYRRAVRQGAIWVATRFASESERFLDAAHAFLPGEWTEAAARQHIEAHKGPLEKIRGVTFRAHFKLVPIAIGDFVPASLDPAFANAIFQG